MKKKETKQPWYMKEVWLSQVIILPLILGPEVLEIPKWGHFIYITLFVPAFVLLTARSIK